MANYIARQGSTTTNLQISEYNYSIKLCDRNLREVIG